uniref:Uncharacterized protein n=1 Tax=Brugia timori TaxID=42155 RepID=A0A0R3QD06_9BILA
MLFYCFTKFTANLNRKINPIWSTFVNIFNKKFPNIVLQLTHCSMIILNIKHSSMCITCINKSSSFRGA